MPLIDPKTAFDNFYDRRRYKIAKNFSAIIFAVFFLLCFFFWNEETELFVYYILAFILMAFCLVYILFSKKYKTVYYIISIGGTLLIIGASNFGSHAIHYSTSMWSLLTIVLAFFGAHVTLGKVLTVIHIVTIAIFLLFFFEENLEHLQRLNLMREIGTILELCSNTFLTAYIVNQFVVFHNYSNSILQTANQKLAQKNDLISAKSKENETLVKEIHHRVKNNLQIITSLLRLQKGELPPEFELKFDEAIGRIMTMSLIHQKLYQEAELSKLVLRTYILDLVEEIKSAFQHESKVIITVNSTIDSVGLKTIVPFGLLINELVSNSFKHAFKPEDKGQILIEVTPGEKDLFVFNYGDNGTWKEPDASSSKFGTELISTLTEQLDGFFERNGSHYQFHLTDIDT
ncbi:MAG: hypothetical protein JKY42_09085 [Flavobacteriales bacterium]|nr:hypothetical protein [Flavobacteriales bacterium]